MVMASPVASLQRTSSHVLTWALIDPVKPAYYRARCSIRSRRIALEDLEKGSGPRDEWLTRRCAKCSRRTRCRCRIACGSGH
jgi:hypothetical protein